MSNKATLILLIFSSTVFHVKNELDNQILILDKKFNPKRMRLSMINSDVEHFIW